MASPLFLLSFILLSLFHTPTIANTNSYIVYLGTHSHGREPSAADLERATNSHYHLLGSYLGSEEKARDSILYSYNRHINGFAAVINAEEAEQIAKHPNVVSVFPNKGRKLHTTRSWDFLGLERDGTIPSQSIWKKARFGEDTIIANLDTGVWPESKSFNDEGFGAVPPKWRGICQHDGNVRCNRKLIGARYFNKGYKAFAGKLNSTELSTARDYEGHGTHTLSTAAGNFVSKASVFGNGNGTAKGGSPRARVAAYKVCWPSTLGGGCFDADILAAFEAAISDGVDVISVSLGGSPIEFLAEGISIGSFHAIKKGIVVVSSAGNDGPIPGSVSNVSPWMLTVGASSIDREFTTYVALGNKKHVKGASLSAEILPSQKFYPLISAVYAKAANASASDASLCFAGSLDRKKVKGKILVCVRGETARAEKGHEAALAGAVGLILVNDFQSGNEIIADTHFLPTSHVTYKDGVTVFHYINSTKNPNAYLTSVRTELETKPAPVMASFSSRGPNTIEPSLLKPDITAPGLSIIAAYTEGSGPTGLPFDKRRTPFNTESGTSMSCPHVSGIVGLLKTLHPDWSPSAIKSAIMTTARTRDDSVKPITDSSNQKATPFAYGSGHVRPNRAMDPGLVYDLTINDYLNFLCAHGYNQSVINLFTDKPHKCPKSFALTDFNYPSISVPKLSRNRSVTISRKVKNVGSPGTYVASVKSPPGVSTSVVPKALEFEKIGEEKTYKVVLRRKNKAKGNGDGYAFGRLSWSDGKHYVRSPIAVNLG